MSWSGSVGRRARIEGASVALRDDRWPQQWREIRLICARVPTALDAVGSTPKGLLCVLWAGRSPT
jgi:hypothetical protein